MGELPPFTISIDVYSEQLAICSLPLILSRSPFWKTIFTSDFEADGVAHVSIDRRKWREASRQMHHPVSGRVLA
jgi:hypothetical protein